MESMESLCMPYAYYVHYMVWYGERGPIMLDYGSIFFCVFVYGARCISPSLAQSDGEHSYASDSHSLCGDFI